MPDVTIPDTPQTREETYLAAANGQDVELPDPMTREEAYLYEIATKMQGGGSSVTVEPLSVTANGEYTAPSGKAYSPVTVEVDTDEWQRPADWPDLDSITIPAAFEGVYLTYDMRKTPGYAFISLLAKTQDNSQWTVERGHLSSSGEFVAEESHSVDSNKNYIADLDSSLGSVQLWRVTGGNITQFGLTAKNSNGLPNSLQPCVEIVGKLPNLTTMHGYAHNVYPSYTANISDWTERWSVSVGAFLTDISSAFSSPRICVLDVSKIDTRNVTNASYCFAGCLTKDLDISTWRGDSLQNVSYMFFNCHNLEMLNASGFEIPGTATGASGFAVTSGNLVDVHPFATSKSVSFGTCDMLTIASLIRIIDALPAVAETQTLTIGAANTKKLTAEQIDIATEKGWTVA